MITLFVILLAAIAPAYADPVSAYAAGVTSPKLLNSTPNPALDAAALEAAGQYGVPFDRDVQISRIITTEDGRYYIVEYKNYLPLAGGIEVLAENGTKVANSSQAKSILKAVAWTESIQSLEN
ncbi:hypothetical protein RCIX1993 [Methanocella arvoryzae MRE50]|uniref:Uncharacterized protein n=1 Tax=Methanocella arvoryzae (strain DSM 22066 / NBRC 105507 / MRE50) TaxID=351160 RepID=Q0W391_METAR|nr:hypothetical protein RCIX1993 [Methanocella arvoryzae MRE50]